MSVNDQKLTEWFDGKTTVPGQVGVYRRKFVHPSFSITYRYTYWNGEYWGATWRAADVAAEAYKAQPDMRGAYQDLDWCGLLEEHKTFPKGAICLK